MFYVFFLIIDAFMLGIMAEKWFSGKPFTFYKKLLALLLIALTIMNSALILVK